MSKILVAMSLESDLAEVDSEGTASRPLSAKEKRAKKAQFERDFRVEVRNLKAVSRRLVVACADISRPVPRPPAGGGAKIFSQNFLVKIGAD